MIGTKSNNCVKSQYLRAVYKFKPIKGNFPEANYPIYFIQIDHTPIDIILRDKKQRHFKKEFFYDFLMSCATLTGIELHLR